MQTNLLKLSGIFSMLGAVPLLVAEFIGLSGGDPLSTEAAMAEMISFLFLPFGAIGLYYFQKEKMGILGLIATIFIVWGQVWGNAGLGGSLIYKGLIPNWAGEDTMVQLMEAGGLPGSILAISVILFGTIGMIVFGVMTVRAKVFPAALSWLYLIGAIGILACIPINPRIGHAFNILLAVAWGAMGNVMIKKS